MEVLTFVKCVIHDKDDDAVYSYKLQMRKTYAN